MSEQIKIIKNETSLSVWEPQNYGNEVLNLLKFKDRNNNLIQENGFPTLAGNQIIQETTQILRLCGDPKLSYYNETGIVIGYVQSGKTLSFTTLSAMARDNDYQLIIVIAGTTTSLSNQTTKRLSEDLRLDKRNDRRWSVLQNPKSKDHIDALKQSIEQWGDRDFPKNRCQSKLITVMKNGKHLSNFAKILSKLSLNNVPTLIIDDEGDQASMNTNARKAANEGKSLSEVDASTIYRRINEIRSLLPHHTFLQYTATPQAPLFVNIMDRLSPNFIKLLTPGQNYTGGKTFFIDNPDLVVSISTKDIETNDNILESMPESLIEALQYFFLGVSIGLPNYDEGNRTMMIHPSRITDSHSRYEKWVKDKVGSWIRLFNEHDADDDKQQIIKEFEIVYLKLVKTIANVPDFEKLIANKLLQQAIQYTLIKVVNASEGKTPTVFWKDNYSHILIGGQALDRGFTVEGLTITYMPRGMGTSNVDTILQRARFFGYKKSYLGFCRLFLPEEVIAAYKNIVQHEEDVRTQLEKYNIDNEHLNNWNREAVLNEMLNLTRRNVIFNDLERDRFGANKWFRIDAPHDTPELVGPNRNALFNFLETKRDFFNNTDDSEGRTTDQRHLTAILSLKECLQNLLNMLRFTRESESFSYTTLRSLLTTEVDKNPNAECKVYLMGVNNLSNWTPRTRTLTDKDIINQLFQGRSPKIGTPTYMGDYEMKDSNRLTIQIHYLNLMKGNELLEKEVPSLAIWLPNALETHIIRQPTNRK